MSKLKKNESITHVMTKDPATVRSDAKISEAAAMVLEQGYHHIPVLNGEKLVGMFSYTDLMRIDFADSFGQDRREVMATLDASKTLDEVISKDLVTVTEKDTVHDAATKLCSGSFHSLPVVGEGQKLVGLVTSTDIIRYLAELY